jgi:hypothetical protein
MQEFIAATPGNWCIIHVNEEKSAESIVFQSARMSPLFAAYPQVVMVDCTHSTNRSKFVLFSFVIDDSFGKVGGESVLNVCVCTYTSSCPCRDNTLTTVCFIAKR